MFEPFTRSGNEKEDDAAFLSLCTAYLACTDAPVTNYAQVSALLFWYLDDITWVGFYLLEDDALVLGPFQGLPACTRIALGKGVCGMAAKEKVSLVVDDVHSFPSYIACEGAVQSELVSPVLKDGRLLAILDCDSNTRARFTSRELKLFEAVCSIIASVLPPLAK